MDSLFTEGFPEGRIDYYVENDNRSRTTKEEDRLLNLNIHEIETSMRKAAEVHKEVRSYLQARIRPGMRYWDLCCDIEDKVRFLIGENGPLVLHFIVFHPIGRNGFSYRCLTQSYCCSLHTKSW